MATAILNVEDVGEHFTYIAVSPVMRAVRAQIDRLAKVDVPVLISGESGTGKELTVRLIHYLSARSKQPLIRVNCAALDQESLGWADCGPAVRHSQADVFSAGTVLLEEVADIPMKLQSKLVAIMNGRQFEGNSPGLAHSRVLATTSLSLDKALTEKRLREDLYYRLSAFTLQLPPLRQRREDTSLLVRFFISSAARRYKLEPPAFSDELLIACAQYSWPGNLRELESFAQRFVVIGDEALAVREIQEKAMSQAGVVVKEESPPEGRSGFETHHGLKTLVRSVTSEAERSAILGALDKTRWNRKQAARLLGISYRGILYKIEKYQLTPPAPRTPGGASLTPLRAMWRPLPAPGSSR
ncbi:MAG TPA: sigma 54-interacting transcriptional regulator [Terriglobales bacterium]